MKSMVVASWSGTCFGCGKDFDHLQRCGSCGKNVCLECKHTDPHLEGKCKQIMLWFAQAAILGFDIATDNDGQRVVYTGIYQ